MSGLKRAGFEITSGHHKIQMRLGVRALIMCLGRNRGGWMAFSWLLFCLQLSASLPSFPSQRGYLHALHFLPVFHRCCVITDAKLMAGMGRVRGRCSALSSSSSLTVRQVLCSQSLHLRHSQHPWLPFHGSPWMSGLHLALMFGLGWDRADARYLKVAELCLLSTQDPRQDERVCLPS